MRDKPKKFLARATWVWDTFCRIAHVFVDSVDGQTHLQSDPAVAFPRCDHLGNLLLAGSKHQPT